MSKGLMDLMIEQHCGPQENAKETIAFFI
jgi:hypothetical protein